MNQNEPTNLRFSFNLDSAHICLKKCPERFLGPILTILFSSTPSHCSCKVFVNPQMGKIPVPQLSNMSHLQRSTPGPLAPRLPLLHIYNHQRVIRSSLWSAQSGGYEARFSMTRKGSQKNMTPFPPIQKYPLPNYQISNNNPTPPRQRNTQQQSRTVPYTIAPSCCKCWLLKKNTDGPGKLWVWCCTKL